MSIELYHGDCLIESKKIKPGSVDLILTDLPYGTMAGIDKKYVGYGRKEGGGHLWDLAIDPKKVYEIANRVLRKNGKMVLFSQEPYTGQLTTQAIPNVPFNYRMIWQKDNFANALLCNKAPVSYYEDILVFSKTHDTDGVHPLREYFAKVLKYIGKGLKQINDELGHRRAEHSFYISSTQFSLCTETTYIELIEHYGIGRMDDFISYEELVEIDRKTKDDHFPSIFNLWEGGKYKSNILRYKKDYDGYHPTQKPVLLLEDLIKTFSNEGDTVVDLTMGSGSTGVACKNTGREFIGVELDEEYFKIATERIGTHEKNKFSLAKAIAE